MPSLVAIGRAKKPTLVSLHSIVVVVWFFSAVIVATIRPASATPCDLCPNSTLALPDKTIPVPALNLSATCGTVEKFVLTLEGDQPECRVLQSIATLCGCPKPQGACEFCGGGNAKLGYPQRELPFLDLDGFSPTCEILEAYLQSTTDDDAICLTVPLFVAEFCGCSREHNTTASPSIGGCPLCSDGKSIIRFPEKELGIEGFPIRACGDLALAMDLLFTPSNDQCSLFQRLGTYCGCPAPENPCSLCQNNVLPPQSTKNKTLPVFAPLFFGIAPSCGLVESSLMGLNASSNECFVGRLAGGACGCPPVENACILCDGGTVPTEFADFELKRFAPFTGITPTCKFVVDDIASILPADNFICKASQNLEAVCGCNNGLQVYLGADTVAKQKALNWLPRVSAVLSIFGSGYIIVDIVREHSRRKHVYHQIMFQTSIFDICGALAWSLSSLPVPEGKNDFGEPKGYYGAIGNSKSCTAQGFFLQLGYTAALYQMSLSTYFVFTVIFSWQESRIRKLRLWMYGLPLLGGLGLAIGGIRYYADLIFICYVQPPPISENYAPILILGVVPLILVTAYSTLAILAVYLHVRKRSSASTRWRHNSGRSRELERQAFSQCVAYLAAYLLSWPIQIASPFVSGGKGYFDESSYWFWLAFVALAPLQGFINFGVYIRPRFMKSLSGSMSRLHTPATDALVSNSRTRHGVAEVGDVDDLVQGPPGCSEGGGIVADHSSESGGNLKKAWNSELDPCVLIANDAGSTDEDDDIEFINTATSKEVRFKLPDATDADGLIAANQ